MKPRKEQKTLEPRREEKPRRFRIERLEERIAPTTSNKTGNWSPGGVGGEPCKLTGNGKCH